MSDTTEQNGSTPPEKPETSGDGDRDPVTGRWIRGNRANPAGRPKGYDFRAIIRDFSERQGVSVEQAVEAVYVALVKKAKGGDVQAARLLLDRLCTQDAIEVKFPGSGMTDAERLARLGQLVAAAERRRRATEEGSANTGDV